MENLYIKPDNEDIYKDLEKLKKIDKYNNLKTPIKKSEFIDKREKEEIYKKIDYYKSAKDLSSIFKVLFKPTQSTTTRPRVVTTTNWSPQSDAGIVYEWDRGVIAIDSEGQIVKERLDDTDNHHADATVRLSSIVGIDINPTTQPYEAGCEAANNNLVILQSEGDGALFYLPDEINEEQARSIEEIAAPRKNFNISFAYKGVPTDNISYEELMTFVRGITKSLAKAM